MNRSLTALCWSLLFANVALAQTRTLSLEDALSLARTSSPVLRAARAEFAFALAAERGAKAMAGPWVSANGFASTGNNSSILTSVPRTEPSALMQIPPGSFSDGNLMLMIPIIAGDVRAMADSARWQSKAAAGDYREAEADLALKVTEEFYSVEFMHEDVIAAEANLNAARELLKTTEARVESGAAIEASVQRVRAEVSRSERGLATARNNEAKALLDLKQTIGLKLETEVELSGAPVAKIDQPSLAGLLESARKERGALLSARARTEAAASELFAARALGLPRLYATGMADATNRRDMGGLTLGLAISFPIWDGGRVQSEVEKAKAMKQRVTANLTETELQVEKEVRQAALDQATAMANLTSAEAAQTAAESAYTVIKLRVEAGKAILLEQLDALDALTRSRTELAQARLDLSIATARLKRATGGNP
ncbi:MAG: TolC family protein [Armatimonadetes bacterium]|nr:TolC family protein [Armatimonadota bacterium]